MCWSAGRRRLEGHATTWIKLYHLPTSTTMESRINELCARRHGTQWASIGSSLLLDRLLGIAHVGTGSLPGRTGNGRSQGAQTLHIGADLPTQHIPPKLATSYDPLLQLLNHGWALLAAQISRKTPLIGMIAQRGPRRIRALSIALDLQASGLQAVLAALPSIQPGRQGALRCQHTHGLCNLAQLCDGAQLTKNRACRIAGIACLAIGGCRQQARCCATRCCRSAQGERRTGRLRGGRRGLGG